MLSGTPNDAQAEVINVARYDLRKKSDRITQSSGMCVCLWFHTFILRGAQIDYGSNISFRYAGRK